MADDNTIIEGTVKFRDGKKWKSRWCVMRKLSPVADCVHLLVYRDARARWGGAPSKASLSLQQFLGCEAGFTLDKHSHTLALLCRDFTAVLAFETRERLMQWQVKVGAHLGEARQHLVLVGAGGRRLAAGPARLLLLQRRFALTAGVPPRLLGVWEIAHLRRYGVVNGRFCFEGGSHCGKGEGLHVLVTDRAADVARDFDLASAGKLSPKRRPLGMQSPNCNTSFVKPPGRKLELNTIDRSLPLSDLDLYEDPCIGEDGGAISPYWPSAERTHFQDMGLGETASVNGMSDGADPPPWGGDGNVTLERCMSCMSKLGALSRSSTAALTPGAKHFSPSWTMEAVNETALDGAGLCRCPPERPSKQPPEIPPERPPKPATLELNLTRKPIMPTPVRSFSHSHLASIGENNATSIGPYENYDVPKIPLAEVEGQYYDTPKRLKECLNSELFKIAKNSTSNSLILKKPCGCLLKLGKKIERPTIVDTDESFQATSCPCRRVTDWANAWIRLPTCRRSGPDVKPPAPSKETVGPAALYATVDLARKTKRKTPNDKFLLPDQMSRSLDSRTIEVDEGPQANYENLNFALSLEHYENAKDLLKKAGVTQAELDALGAHLRPTTGGPLTGDAACGRCGHARSGGVPNDEYLMMEPNSLESNKFEREKSLPAGYTPMSPIGSFGFPPLKFSARSLTGKLLDEKAASNPTLGRPEAGRPAVCDERSTARTSPARPDRRQRSSSADSSRFLDDVQEFDGSVGSLGSASSVETLRDVGAREPSELCACAAGKLSDADSSEASKARGCAAAAGNRDSSSSNDSGVSSWSLRAAPREVPAPGSAARRRFRSLRRAADGPRSPPRSPLRSPRRSRSSGARPAPGDTPRSLSAEAEVPVLSIKPVRGSLDTPSTSSGTSDMSDYIETLSICSSHSSSDTPVTMRVLRHATSTLRPRSGKEYQPLAPHLAARPQRYAPLP